MPLLAGNCPKSVLPFCQSLPDWLQKIAVKNAWEYYLQFGAMPRITHGEYRDEDRKKWLQDYNTTYLQRDLQDLSNLRDLNPFVKAQQLMAINTARLFNNSQLANNAQVNVDTTRRFVRYLEISYHVILLQAWYRNKAKRLTRMPKIHFIDPGISHSVGRFWGEISGHFFETVVISEIYKQIKTHALDAQMYHIRTYDGREIDCLIETAEGFIAIECKQTARVSKKDIRHLIDIENFLDKKCLLGLVVSNDRTIHNLGDNMYAVPAPWFLS